MPECGYCGAFVTDDYVRVFARDGRETVDVCPHCEDRVRSGSSHREARAPRRVDQRQGGARS